MLSLTLYRLCTFAAIFAFITPAYADIEYKNSSGGSLKFYGQFDSLYLSFDDGVSSTTELADNSSSSSRFGFWLLQSVGEAELRFRLETALGVPESKDFSQTSSLQGIDWGRTQLRHVDLQFETARYGTFYFGQGSMATDGLGDQDASGTGLATSVSIGDVAAAFEFRTGTGALSGVLIGDAFPNFDGSKRGRIRYDTPKFAGFTFGAAYGEKVLSEGNSDRFFDTGLGYEAEFENGVELEFGLGYAVRERAGSINRQDTFASASVLFPSGFNATFATGDRNTAGGYNYAKFGYVADVFSVGATALSVDFYFGAGTETEGDQAKTFGLAFVQEFDDQNVEAYFGYRNYSYSDTSPISYLDAISYVIGARWRF